jgi:hypothetical protein
MDCQTNSRFIAKLQDFRDRQETVVLITMATMPMMCKIAEVYGDYLTIRKMDRDDQTGTVRFSLFHIPLHLVAGIEQTESIHEQDDESKGEQNEFEGPDQSNSLPPGRCNPASLETNRPPKGRGASEA